jgi:hypothetical protein
MRNLPETRELIDLLRTANQEAIRRRLDEIDAEEAALRALLRSIQARDRAARLPSATATSRRKESHPNE